MHLGKARHHANAWIRICESACEQMLMETQKMQDEVMELKVLTAIAANRMTRLDNPILNAKLHELKRDAEQLFRAEN
jgi:hypothetical protein